MAYSGYIPSARMTKTTGFRAALALVIAATLVPSRAAQTPVPLRTADGVFEFAANSSDGTVTVTDRLNQAVLSRSLTCPGPALGGFSPDEVSVLVLCASNELVFLNTAAFDVTARVPLGSPPVSVVMDLSRRYADVRSAADARLALIDTTTQRRVDAIPTPPQRPAASQTNQVFFLGMIHGEHRTSQAYGIEVLKRVVTAIRPEYWLTEIPPNRLTKAMDEYARAETIAEPRVSRFPEYVDVLFPLSREIPFQVYGTAGWNYPMDRFRRERLADIERSPARSADWRQYQAAITASRRALAAGGAADDPRWIHTDEYDAAQRLELDIYNALFDRELGTGGWDTINRAHFAHIEKALDAHIGQGTRILITYGAGHKSWMLPRLRQRADVTVVDVRSYFPAPGAVR